MKPRYYLARWLAGSLQYSNDYFTSLKKAEKARSKCVNPCQWIIVVNPLILSDIRRVDVVEEQKRQHKKLREAYEILQEFIYTP